MPADPTPSFLQQTLPPKGTIRRRFLTWLRLTDQPVVRVYRGYGTPDSLMLAGHVLRLSPLARTTYRNNPLVNLLAVLRLFMVRPYPHATVRLTCAGQTTDARTDADGYFQTELRFYQPLPAGWHAVEAKLVSQTITPETVLAQGTGLALVPYPTPFGCISDIDDTFLISHSATLLKRLWVLLTENARSRRPFDGVVAHYQLLAEGSNNPGRTNPFFYVSSSEWNLYDYIGEFAQQNQLPDGIYRLAPLKRFSQLLQTGRGKHATKFDRIEQILQTYPNQSFILLGDDSQQDPVIFEKTVARFGRQIRAVYIRRVYPLNRARTESLVAQMQAAGVPCCYFTQSAEARQHSITIGLAPASSR